MVVAMTLAGDLTFNPITDTLKDKDGKEFKLKEPSGDGLPTNGYDPGQDTYQAPPADRSSVSVAVSPTSDRLQILEPFQAWDGKDKKNLPILIKALVCRGVFSFLRYPIPSPHHLHCNVRTTYVCLHRGVVCRVQPPAFGRAFPKINIEIGR